MQLPRSVREHLIEYLPAIIAIGVLGVLAVFYIWGIVVLVTELNALVTPVNQATAITTFDIEAASKLDLRGLVE